MNSLKMQWSNGDVQGQPIVKDGNSSGNGTRTIPQKSRSPMLEALIEDQYAAYCIRNIPWVLTTGGIGRSRWGKVNWWHWALGTGHWVQECGSGVRCRSFNVACGSTHRYLPSTLGSSMYQLTLLTRGHAWLGTYPACPETLQGNAPDVTETLVPSPRFVSGITDQWHKMARGEYKSLDDFQLF